MLIPHLINKAKAAVEMENKQKMIFNKATTILPITLLILENIIHLDKKEKALSNKKSKRFIE